MATETEAPRVAAEPVPARPKRGPNRTWRLLQKLHRWASLALGLVLLAIVLSGVVLVLAPEIDEWTQPGLFRSTPSERPLSPEQAVAVVRRELPDFQPVDVVRTRGIYQVWGTEYEEAAHVDPGSGRLLGTSSSLTGVMGFMRNLHLCALSCKGYTGYLSFLEAPTPILGNEELTVGGLILAVFGLMLLFLCVTGIVLWWPGIKRMARGFRVRRRKGTYAFNYDLHNVVGIAAVPLLLMWAITGAGFELKQVRDVWYAVLPGAPPAEVEDLTSKPGSGPGISIDRAEQIALAKVAGSRAVSVSVPDAKTKDSAYLVYVASGSDPYDHGTWPGNVGVGVDRYSGRAAVTYDHRDGSLASVWEDWQYPFHAGYFAGWGWRSAWLVFGLAPLLLAVTGVTTWWMRRRKRRRKRRPVMA